MKSVFKQILFSGLILFFTMCNTGAAAQDDTEACARKTALMFPWERVSGKRPRKPSLSAKWLTQRSAEPTPKLLLKKKTIPSRFYTASGSRWIRERFPR